MKLLTFHGKTGQFRLSNVEIGDYIEVLYGGNEATQDHEGSPPFTIFTCQMTLLLSCNDAEPELVHFSTASRLSRGALEGRTVGEKLILTPSEWRYINSHNIRYCALLANGKDAVERKAA